MTSNTTPPHIAMIVANDVTIDTRVRKTARAVARAGMNVTVLGISPSAAQDFVEPDGVRVILVEVGDRLRERSWSGYAERTRRHVVAKDLELERSAFFNFQRDVGAAIGWLRHDYFTGRSERLRKVRQAPDGDAEHSHGRRGGEGDSLSRPAAFPHRDEASTPLPAAWTQRIRRKQRWWRHVVTEAILERRFRWSERRLHRRLEKQYRRYRRRERRMLRLLQRPSRRPNIGWRRHLPALSDYDAAFAPLLDSLRPDGIHAHDIHLLGVAARAAARARVGGREVRVIYDAHEYVRGLATYSPAQLNAFSRLESRYIRRVDGVVTVSPMLAELLRRDHDLPKLPTVVLNVPDPVPDTGVPSVRERSGAPTGSPLVVYAGGVDPSRGVDVLIRAISAVDQAHLALVVGRRTTYLEELLRLAEEGGYRERIHIAPFVPPEQVPAYLSSATVAVHPLTSGPVNHEVALPNKIFDYVHARLPVVVSDCRAMGSFVEAHGIGVVFRSGEVESLVAALQEVLENPERFRKSYEKHPELLRDYSWQVQQQQLLQLYSELFPSASLKGGPSS